MSDADEQQASAFYEMVSASIRAKVTGLGFPQPEKPPAHQFTVELSELNDVELSTQLGYWASITAYGKYQQSLCDASATGAELEYNQEVMLRSQNAEGTSASARKQAAARSTTARSLQRRANVLRGDATVLKALVEGYEIKYAAVSRELTRRRDAQDRA